MGSTISEKIVLALVSAIVGSSGTYIFKAVQFEGRLEAIEKSLGRIESRLFPIPEALKDHGK